MSTVDLFSPFRLGPLQLPNRLVMAPMTRNRAGPGNVPGPLNATYYAQRAGAGLIVSEATQISPEGVGYPGTPGIHSAEQIEGWKEVTEAVHGAGGRIVLQLWHVGRISHPTLQPGGALPVAPSAVAPAVSAPPVCAPPVCAPPVCASPGGAATANFFFASPSHFAKSGFDSALTSIGI